MVEPSPVRGSHGRNVLSLSSLVAGLMGEVPGASGKCHVSMQVWGGVGAPGNHVLELWSRGAMLSPPSCCHWPCFVCRMGSGRRSLGPQVMGF